MLVNGAWACGIRWQASVRNHLSHLKCWHLPCIPIIEKFQSIDRWWVHYNADSQIITCKCIFDTTRSWQTSGQLEPKRMNVLLSLTHLAIGRFPFSHLVYINRSFKDINASRSTKNLPYHCKRLSHSYKLLVHANASFGDSGPIYLLSLFMAFANNCKRPISVADIR